MTQCVLLDDDMFVREAWECMLTSVGVAVVTCESVEELMDALDSLAHETPIFLDADISPEVRGEEVAARLHELGYRELYLSTGYEASCFDSLTCIKGVLGKEPPEWLMTSG